MQPELDMRFQLPGRIAAIGLFSVSALTFAACGDDDDDDVDAGLPGDGGGGGDGGAPAGCDQGRGSRAEITLPDGFCATVFADEVGRARHITVTPSGDVYVAIGDGSGDPGSLLALRDSDGDGVADQQMTFAPEGGNGIAWDDGELFVGHDNRIVRYALPDGQLTPSGEPDVVVGGLPVDGDHTAKTVVVAGGELYVNIGSASNSCQEMKRELESPGKEPCPELPIRAGIWSFDRTATDLGQGFGTRVATGVRNGNALAVDPESGRVWAAVNGRDQLFENWPQLYTEADDQRLPSEEIVEIADGLDNGWPYCYHDVDLGHRVLAPEYGGDGEMIGRCAEIPAPAQVLPAHWAPLGMTFYRGTMFPEHYRGGAFIANHGSRFAPEAAGDPPGYEVVFLPFAGGAPSGAYERFGYDFAGDERPLPEAAKHRTVGVAEGPDGSLYITDDQGGRIWRVYYRP